MWQALSPGSSTFAEEETTPRSLLRINNLQDNPSPIYRLVFNPQTNGYDGEFEHFKVKSNRIFITSSDGQPGRGARPHPDNTYHDRKANIDRESILSPVPLDSKASRGWRLTLGGFIAAIMFGMGNIPGQHSWYLQEFPQHYALFARDKDRTNKEGSHRYRRDYYLHGSPSTVTSAFRSANEFARHALWLMDGMPRDAHSHSRCLCIYCCRTPDGDLPPQRLVTDELRRVRREILLGGQESDSELEAVRGEATEDEGIEDEAVEDELASGMDDAPPPSNPLLPFRGALLFPD